MILHSRPGSFSRHAISPPQSTAFPISFVLGMAMLIACHCFPVMAADVHPADNAAIRVHSLIQRLGSTQFSIRKSAADELRRLGDVALDPLLEAQYDEDLEVRSAIRELLSQFQIRWLPENSPQIIQEITAQYDAASHRDKIIYAFWLVRLEDGMGLPAWARIVRYEKSEIIAKQAALALIDELDQEDPVQVNSFQRVVQHSLAASSRTHVRWLERFAADLQPDRRAPNGLPSWKRLAMDELKRKVTERFDPFVTAALCQQWAADALKKDDARAVREAVEQLITLRQDSIGLIVETAIWLIEENQHALFEELIWDKFEDARDSEPLLAYCQYMSKLKQGLQDEAQTAGDIAFEMTESDTQFPDAFERGYTRLQLAQRLEVGDFTEAAIREYRRLIAMEKNYQISRVQYQAVSRLSELLHDRQQDLEAAKVLEKIALPGKNSLIEEFEEDSTNVSRMYYFRSEHHRQRGERAKQIEYLNKAIEASPTDADVLIAMYRLPRADQQWKQRTSDLIAAAVAEFENSLAELQREGGDFENRVDAAAYMNQVAWLVANTEGDFAKAIQQSRRSLELRPASGEKLDTLGRAYYAAGDLSNAIRYQRRAVRLLPSSQQILRQLEEFEQKQ